MTTRLLTVKVSESVLERLRTTAKANGTTMSAHVRMLLGEAPRSDVQDQLEDLDRRLARLEEMAHGA